MSEPELTPENVAEALGLKPKPADAERNQADTAPADGTPDRTSAASPVGDAGEPDVSEVSDTNDHVDEQQERDAEAEWLANHQRQLQRLQEEHPENAAELAVLFGNPEQSKAEHDWLMRMHQPRPEDAA